MNEILLRRRHKLALEKGSAQCPSDQHIVMLMKNIESLGFILSKEVYEVLTTYTVEELTRFYSELLPVLKKLVGADVEYRPMYVNFPESVMEECEIKLYLNALIHYWSSGTWKPEEEKVKRALFGEFTDKTELTLAAENESAEIFRMLCESKTSISDTDKADLIWLLENVTELRFPDEIPLKENAALIGKLYLEHHPLAKAEEIQKYFKTATDVLRLITAMSDGDLSLAESCRYRSFKRRERKLLMELLMGCGALEEDMRRYRGQWVRVGERIHPSEYSREKYGKVLAAFDKIRSDETIPTFYTYVEKALEERNVKGALSLLEKRPGELARRLDYLFRISASRREDAEIIECWRKAAPQAASTVLLQVREHFHRRNENEQPIRVFFPKGKLAKAIFVPNELKNLEQTVCDEVAAICEDALIQQFAEKEPLGKVYLSEEFRQYLVPFSQRSASKAMRTIVRGSKLPIDEKSKVLRAFIWWTDMDYDDGRVDIDLTATVYDKNWNYKTHVSYMNLRSLEYRMVHSGDIVSGGPADGAGVAEFLDVDIDSVVRNGGRYVVYQVYCYTWQTFAKIANCRFGWMERQNVGSGEIFEPQSVKQRMDLTTENTVAIPAIFDCVTREVIWCDMIVPPERIRSDRGGNNVESNLNGVTLVCYAMTHLVKPNLYDLVRLHILARGERVETKEEADVVFDVEEGITPFSAEYIQSELL